VAADWHELILTQYSMRPSIACLSEDFDLQFAASRQTTTINHARLSPNRP